MEFKLKTREKRRDNKKEDELEKYKDVIVIINNINEHILN